jgi:hypothetical protein
MTIGFFLWGNDSIKEVLLSALQLLLTTSWIYLFIVSLKSHFVTPTIIPQQKREISSKIHEENKKKSDY